jgi:hypothetical protein
MKYAKILGLLAIATAALMAFAGSASATTLTDTNGNQIGLNAIVHAENVGNTVLDGTVNITCKKSTVEGKITNAGSATETVSGPIEALTFEECGNNTVTVVNKGTLEIHTDSTTIVHENGTHTTLTTGDTGDGTLTSSGARITVLTHNILGTVHCIYITGNTRVGTLHGSEGDLGVHETPTLTVNSAPIPREGTDFGCGSTSDWTAHYTVTTPDYIWIH